MKDSVADTLLRWYESHARDLPWRQIRDAYRIWLSEVILQQTRVAQGLDYYLRFVERFPTVQTLAAASEDEVLKLWQGLGYYSRARNLHAAAKQIVTEFGGEFPRHYEAIRSLRGVGEYTAAAIASIAYNLPYAVVDGNVYRVLSRLYDIDLPIDSTEGRRLFAALAQECLPLPQAGLYNQAIMDFGALHCTPAQPRCGECPLAEQCLARSAGTVALRPVKQGRTRVRDRYFSYLHIRCGGRVPLVRRGEGDIWQGLYEFPLIESPSEVDFAQVASSAEFTRWAGDAWHLVRTVAMPPHQLSHQRLHATFYCLECPQLTPQSASVAVAESALGEYAVSRLTERYLLQG